MWGAYPALPRCVFAHKEMVTMSRKNKSVEVVAEQIEQAVAVAEQVTEPTAEPATQPTIEPVQQPTPAAQVEVGTPPSRTEQILAVLGSTRAEAVGNAEIKRRMGLRSSRHAKGQESLKYITLHSKMQALAAKGLVRFERVGNSNVYWRS